MTLCRRADASRPSRDSEGAVYVYDKEFKLAADFGIAVAVSDDFIVVGSAAFVYGRDFSVFELRGGSGFGVAVAHGIIAVGANGLVSLYENGTQSAPYGCALAANDRRLVVGDCANRAHVCNETMQLTATLENFAVRDRPVGVANDLVLLGNSTPLTFIAPTTSSKASYAARTPAPSAKPPGPAISRTRSRATATSSS